MGILNHVVWLFPQYRTAMAVIDSEQRRIETLERVIEDLSRQARHIPLAPETLLDDFKAAVLADQPFPDGKIPDHYWLSPGDDDRSEKSRG